MHSSRQSAELVKELIIEIINTAKAPLETPEIVELVQQKVKTTRTIVFKRLTDLRGDQEINGKYVGSGKGVWLWWKKQSFTTPQKTQPYDDKIANQVLQTIDSANKPLETKEVEEFVQNATPSTRTIVFKRLTDFRGDGAIRGKQIGSGKGTWVWWRNNALQE